MKKQTSIISILIIVFAALIAVFTIFGGIYLFTASKKLKAVELTPDFMETELEVGSQYTFTINATPAKASLKKLSGKVDDELCTFELSKDGSKATLTTGLNEGTVTVFVESKDIKSQVLTFSVVDSVARAQAEAELAAAQAEAEAQAAAEAEAAAAAEAAAVKYVKCTGDNVNVRSQNNTDCEILGKASMGAVFEKIEEIEDWTRIVYNGQDGYMKTEYLTEISAEEAQNPDAAAEENAEITEEKPKEEAKKEPASETSEQTTQTKEEAEAKAKADAEAAALAAQQQALAEAAAAQAALAAAGTTLNCKDGACLVTPAQIEKIHATWDFAGDALEMATHHSISELEAVIGPVTRL